MLNNTETILKLSRLNHFDQVVLLNSDFFYKTKKYDFYLKPQKKMDLVMTQDVLVGTWT